MDHASVNCYLVSDGDGVTVVDAGLPRMWGQLPRVLAAIGHRSSNLRAVVLTHAHFDQVGFARRAGRELNVPVWVHRDDATLAAHPLPLRPRERAHRVPDPPPAGGADPAGDDGRRDPG